MKNWILFVAAMASNAEAAQLDCEGTTVPISAVQGEIAQSPLLGKEVTVKGVLTGDFRGKEALEGFFIQQINPDHNPLTSEGLFIHHKDHQQKLKQGDLIMVKGRVSEQFDVTQLSSVSSVKICKHNHELPAPILLSLPFENFNLETIEGMRVAFKEPAVVTDLYRYLRFGEVTVSSELLLNPTARFRPGSSINAQNKKDQRNRLIIDDGSFKEYPELQWLGENKPITLGQKMNVTGVLHYAFGQYKVQPTQEVQWMEPIDHSKPHDIGGTLRVANFNLKNFFTTIDQGEVMCGPKKNFSCRGADSNKEYKRQINKLITAIHTADPDVVSLQELENVKNSTLSLVNGLNEAAGKEKWSYIETGVLGNDVIRVGMLYQPTRLKPVGQYALLTNDVMAEFDETKHRVVVAQTFLTQNQNKFNMIAAHFKSKSCQDAKDNNLDQKDGQGCYNASRIQAAELVSKWLLTDPTGQAAEYTILAGDLNAYQQEDPIEILQQHGFKNLAEKFLPEKNWTASFRGYVGSLDYVLANPKASNKATGLTQWHINSIYNPLFDYNLEWTDKEHSKPDYFYQPSPFASSDHDMVIAGFEL